MRGREGKDKGVSHTCFVYRAGHVVARKAAALIVYLSLQYAPLSRFNSHSQQRWAAITQMSPQCNAGWINPRKLAQRGSAPKECAQLVLRVTRPEPASLLDGQSAAASARASGIIEINDLKVNLHKCPGTREIRKAQWIWEPLRTRRPGNHTLLENM